MIISQDDFLNILTEPQEILLGKKTMQQFKEFLLKEYKELEHICLSSGEEIVFMEDEESFSSYIKIILDEVNCEFCFWFENEEYSSIAESNDEFKKNIAYIALDTIKIISKWQNLILNEHLSTETHFVDESKNIYKSLCDYFKITNKYKNLTFEISFSGELVEDISTSKEEESSDFDWI